jgi:hypothetical protein
VRPGNAIPVVARRTSSGSPGGRSISAGLAVVFIVAGIGVATFSSAIATVGLVVFLVWALWVVVITVEST